MAADVTARQKAALRGGRGRAARPWSSARRTSDALKKASHALGRVRYFTRFLEEVEAIEEEALA